MKFGRLNIIVGGVVIFLSTIGGFFLGFTMYHFFERGFYAIPLGRVLLKAGHTHSMPFAFYNIIIGSLVDRLSLNDKWKKRCSFFTIFSLIMPIGLILRGITDGAMTFAPVVLIGAIFFVGSSVIMIKGVISNRQRNEN
jgi:hypothetical protein